MNDKKIIFDDLRRLAILKGVDVSKERLTLYCEVLSRFKVEEVKKALFNLGVSIKYFPDISEIVEQIRPTQTIEDKANQVAKEIIIAISRFGSNRSSDAKAHLGDCVWSVVEGLGGWYSLCNQNANSIPTIRAQARDLARAEIKDNHLGFYLPETEKRNLIENTDQPSKQ